MLAYWQDRVVGSTVRIQPARAAGRAASVAATTERRALRTRQARMLDIIPYVSVTVNAHVLLFKPRVGTNMGVCPAPRRMCCKPSAFRDSRACALRHPRPPLARCARCAQPLRALHAACERRCALRVC
jgi:hypothetical protein